MTTTALSQHGSYVGVALELVHCADQPTISWIGQHMLLFSDHDHRL
jgi:hypothetical protein